MVLASEARLSSTRASTYNKQRAYSGDGHSEGEDDNQIDPAVYVPYDSSQPPAQSQYTMCNRDAEGWAAAV